MKPTSPEDREQEGNDPEVSDLYRRSARDEPPPRLDAVVLEAARRELRQLRRPRNWQLPASFAAVLVIGVSLILLVRHDEPALPSLDAPSLQDKLAKSDSAQPAKKVQPRLNTNAHREARPSRERSERPDREPPVSRDQVETAASASAQENTALGAASAAKPAEREQDQFAERKSTTAQADARARAAPQSAPADSALHKQKTEAEPVQPDVWLSRIDELLRQGKETDAREQLLGFKKQFPQYPVPRRLQELLVNKR